MEHAPHPTPVPAPSPVPAPPPRTLSEDTLTAVEAVADSGYFGPKSTLWIKRLLLEVRITRRMMREAIDHCETCRDAGSTRRHCARCQSFQQILDGKVTAYLPPAHAAAHREP